MLQFYFIKCNTYGFAYTTTYTSNSGYDCLNDTFIFFILPSPYKIGIHNQFANVNIKYLIYLFLTNKIEKNITGEMQK